MPETGDVDTDTEAVTGVKNKRKQLRSKITRTINQIKESISKGEQNSKRSKKELEQLRRDYDVTSDLHGQLYDLLDETHHAAMDKWEGDLANAVFAIEEEVEVYLTTLVQGSASQRHIQQTTMQALITSPQLATQIFMEQLASRSRNSSRLLLHNFPSL